MKVFEGLGELGAAGGTDLGATAWVTVEQDRIDGFADVTGDRQWIHVDTERAADGPFGSTIAHGFLTLSLLPVFLGSLYRVLDGAVQVVFNTTIEIEGSEKPSAVAESIIRYLN